jgi:hypothetical protein
VRFHVSADRRLISPAFAPPASLRLKFFTPPPILPSEEHASPCFQHSEPEHVGATPMPARRRLAYLGLLQALNREV